jgi:hypothetical protein
MKLPQLNSAQKFFNDLTLEFSSKTPSVLHGKILSPILRDFGACQLL